VTHNAALGQRDGVPKEKFAALADYTTNPLFSDLERLVIRYAEEMTEKVQVDSRLVEELKKQLGPEALVQLKLSIAAADPTYQWPYERSGCGSLHRPDLPHRPSP